MIKCARVFTIILLLASHAVAQAQNPESDIEAEVAKKEAFQWRAYNNCDIDEMASLLGDNVEFYHDTIGLTSGKPAVINLLKNNICGNPAHRIRREPVPGSVQVSLLRNTGRVYGAVIVGRHQFYVANNGTPEHPQSRAQFTHVWMLADQDWKLTRVLSFEHGPVPYHNKRKTIALRKTELEKFTGSYQAKDGTVFLVKMAGKGLLLATGGKNFTLYPFEKMRFFVKDEDLTFSFSRTGARNAQAIVVRENGGIVEEAMRVHAQ